MSMSKWAYVPERCDGDICCGDCDYCPKTNGNMAIIHQSREEDIIDKIINEIGRYELDCRFADESQTEECTICNKNVFESIYKIINKCRGE